MEKPREADLIRYGKRAILEKMLGEAALEWNREGYRIWAQKELEKLEAEDVREAQETSS